MLTQNAVIETVRNYVQDMELHGVKLRKVILYNYFIFLKKLLKQE